MRIPILLVLLCVGATFVTSGCQSADDGIKPENRQALTDASSLAKKVDGDYDKLSEADKQQLLKMANNNEQQARQLCKLMAHPPNEGVQKGQPPR